MKSVKNIATYITSRLTDYKKSKSTSLYIRISFYSVALSMLVMIFSAFLISGFKSELEHKMSTLYGDLVITESGDIDNTFSQKPLFYFAADSLEMLRKEETVSSVRPYLIDFVMLRSGRLPQGVMVRSAEFDKQSVEQEFMIEGRLPQPIPSDTMSYEIVVSKNIAEQIESSIGKKIVGYFSTPEGDIAIRRLKVVGIYNSSIYEHDDAMIWADLSLLRNLRQIPSEYYHAVSLGLKDPQAAEEAKQSIWLKYLRNPLKIESISQRFGYITDWIELQKTTEYIILSIMFSIALINMISCLLILILDRLPMIGSLKAVGARDSLLQRVFLQLAQRIILRGIFWGNLLALVLAFIQKRYKIITLPEKYYLLKYVPIEFDWSQFASINIGFFALLSLALIIPTLIIRRLKPIQILRYK